jgi:hypothetical protein
MTATHDLPSRIPLFTHHVGHHFGHHIGHRI